MKKLLVTLFASLVCGGAYGQQDFMVSQYMFNEFILNPAYAGSHEYPNVSALFRKQWVNFPGAPTTSFLTYEAPIKNSNSGYGVILSNDNIGVSHQTDLLGAYSYHANFGKSKLSFGVQGGLTFYKANLTELEFWDEADPEFQQNLGPAVHPNFGFGLYYYAPGDYFVGLSTPRVVEYNTNHFLSIRRNQALKYQRHYYMHFGKIFKADEKVVLKPNVLFKYFPGITFQADINLTAYYNAILGVGVSYRTNESIVMLIDMVISKNIKIGVAYDFAIGKFAPYRGGSFEMMASYNIFTKFKGHDIPKFF